MSETTEQVVLLDAAGTRIGVADKAQVHNRSTPLHLAFSCHVFNADGHVLVTRRALGKLTWPGVWSNSFCGHPAPGEPVEDAVRRRATLELGVTLSELEVALPDFRYYAVDASGIAENEICPVYRAVVVGGLSPNPDEVAEWKWVDPALLLAAVEAAPFAFSPWLGWQLEQWPGYAD